LNPDVILEKNALEELFLSSNKLSDFTILAPIEKNFANYGMFDKKNISSRILNQKGEEKNYPFKVDFVDGFAMLLNKKKFKEEIYFDENFFMYLENNDLCKRVADREGSVFVVPTSKINHLAAKAVDSSFAEEVEFSRNWHWIWSKFYFNKKHYGLFKAVKEGTLRYFLSILKFLFYFLINDKVKKKIYFNRASGFYNALLGRASWYRPNLKDWFVDYKNINNP